MGTLCEAFGITKTEAPSTARKKAQKWQSRPKPKVPPKQPKSFVTKEQPKPNQRKRLSKRENQLFATNVVNLVIEPSNAKLNKRLLNSF